MLDKREFIKGTVIFANLERPRIFQNGNTKHSVRLAVNKSDSNTCNKLQHAYRKALLEGDTMYGTTAFSQKTNITSPIKEGVQYYGDSYSNYYILDLNTKLQPQVIDVNKILLPINCIKPGSFVCVAMSFFPYNVNEKCGISGKLHSMMFIRQDKPIVTEISNALEDFSNYELDE